MHSLHVNPLTAQRKKKIDNAMLNDQVPSSPRLAIKLSRGAHKIVKGQPHMMTRYNRTVEPKYLSNGA